MANQVACLHSSLLTTKHGRLTTMITSKIHNNYNRVSFCLVASFFVLSIFLLPGCSDRPVQGEVTVEPTNKFSLTIASDQTLPRVGPHLIVEDNMLVVGESDIFSNSASWFINKIDADAFSITNLAVTGVLSVVEEGSFSDLYFTSTGDSAAQRWSFMQVEEGVCLIYSELMGSEVVLTAIRDQNQNTVKMQNYDPDNVNQNWRFTSVGFDDRSRPCA